MQVEVINLLGQKTRVHPIKSLRKADDKELLDLHYKLGKSMSQRLKTFFPVIVHSTGLERDCIDIFWVDQKSETPDSMMLQAILNG